MDVTQEVPRRMVAAVGVFQGWVAPVVTVLIVKLRSGSRHPRADDCLGKTETGTHCGS